jgi:hypothetical protein
MAATRYAQSAPMPTAWMVHSLTGPNGVKGDLTVEGKAVVFRPAAGRGATETFRFEHIRKVKRFRSSPVLELRLQIPDGLPVVGFYFMKPPSLEAQDGMRFATKGRTRRRAVAALFRGNAERRTEIEALAAEIEREMLG